MPDVPSSRFVRNGYGGVEEKTQIFSATQIVKVTLCVLKCAFHFELIHQNETAGTFSNVFEFIVRRHCA